MTYPPTAYFKPRIVSSREATRRAFEKVQAYRSDSAPVLPTRWAKLNKTLLGGFRFATTYQIAGASGHGKSYLLNMLQQDFLTHLTDGTAPFPYRLLHFSFEMSPEDEFLRKASGQLQMSYGEMLSSKGKVTDRQAEQIKTLLQADKNLPLDFVEEPQTVSQLVEVIDWYELEHPGCKLVISVDHSLLLKEDVGQDELRMVAQLGEVIIMLRKRGHMLIILGQLNDKIESEKRRDPEYPTLHYPTKTDIFGSKQLYHALNVCMVIHQPALMNLEYYGPRNIPTEDLVALHLIKNREDLPGIVLLRNDLANSRFVDWDFPGESPLFSPTNITVGYGFT